MCSEHVLRTFINYVCGKSMKTFNTYFIHTSCYIFGYIFRIFSYYFMPQTCSEFHSMVLKLDQAT